MKRFVYRVDVTDLPPDIRDFVEAITGQGAIESLDGRALRFSVDADDAFGASEAVAEMAANLTYTRFRFPLRPVEIVSERDMRMVSRQGHRAPWLAWSDNDLAILGDGWHDPSVTIAKLVSVLGRTRRSVESQAHRLDLGPKAGV